MFKKYGENLRNFRGRCNTAHVRCKGKCKAIPLRAWTGPEGSRGLRLPDFKTIGTWRW